MSSAFRTRLTYSEGLGHEICVALLCAFCSMYVERGHQLPLLVTRCAWWSRLCRSEAARGILVRSPDSRGNALTPAFFSPARLHPASRHDYPPPSLFPSSLLSPPFRSFQAISASSFIAGQACCLSGHTQSNALSSSFFASFLRSSQSVPVFLDLILA